MKSFVNVFALLLLLIVMNERAEFVESCQTSAANLVDSDPYQLSSHILDITRGVGAANVKIKSLFDRVLGK